jgi:hypothetical protein
MKILKENKLLHEEEVMSSPSETELEIVDDVAAVPVDELADNIQAAAEVASNGEKTFSDENAEKIAAEVKEVALGLDHTMWAPLDVQNELTEALDICLSRSMVAKKQKRTDGVDLIVTGLPGSGKTGITKAWAKKRGVNLFSLKAMNRELDAILNGFPVDTVETTENGTTVHKVIKSRSTILDPLEQPRSVLFLDEFNRAPEDLRANLLTLINEHEVEAASGQGKNGMYRFENLLFTIACINPALPTDPGAMELNDAEMSRYLMHMDYDSNKKDALSYIPWYIRERIDALDKTDPDYAFLYVDLMKTYNLATYLLRHRKFKFDDREDQKECAKARPRRTLLNQRELTDGLMAFGSNVKMFLWWVDTKAEFLEKNKIMFHEILDNYVAPEVTPPTAGGAEKLPNEPTAAAEPAKTDDSPDYAALFNGPGGESDSGLFGNATAASNNVAVSREQVMQRLANLDMTLF